MDTFLADHLNISAGGVQNIRLGFRNLSKAKAGQLKKSLGTASTQIDPYVLCGEEV